MARLLSHCQVSLDLAGDMAYLKHDWNLVESSQTRQHVPLMTSCLNQNQITTFKPKTFQSQAS